VIYQQDAETHMPQFVTPFRRGPAHRAGIKPGDLLVKVDGKSTKGISLEDTANWVRGPEGTPVSVVVRQPKSTEERTYQIVRGVIPIETVVGYRRAGGDLDWHYEIDPSAPIGYIAVTALHSSTPHELRQAEGRLKAERARALVIDLRFAGAATPLHQAEMVGENLVGGGLMWRVHDAQDQVKEVRSSRECLFRDWPMVILIGEETVDPMAKALAAALHDNGRAVLVGETPKMDEYLKTQLDLPGDLGGVMLRTARLERPARDHGWPLEPDHTVPSTSVQRATIEKWLNDKNLVELPAGMTDQPPEDPQLARAVEILKADLKKTGLPDKDVQTAR
jgi:carboxyl-terminal processing protease